MVEKLTLSRMILELIQNSIDADCKKIMIDIKVTSLEKYVYSIEVIDDGMVLGDINSYHEKGYSSKSSSGLGLYLINKFCLENDGYYKFDRINHKSIVTFSFKNIDFHDLTDLVDIIYLTSCNYEIIFNYTYDNYKFTYDSLEIKDILKDISIRELSVMNHLKEFIRNGLKNIK